MPRDGTLASITMQVATAGASGDELAVAIYPSDANGDPGGETAIVRKTDIDASTTGHKTITSISSPTVTGGDIYWFALTPKFGDYPGTCKMKSSIGGIPNLSGRIVGGSSTTQPYSGVSRWGTFSGDPPETIGANDFQYKTGQPTGRYILVNLTFS